MKGLPKSHRWSGSPGPAGESEAIASPLLEVRSLNVEFPFPEGKTRVVDEVDLKIFPGQVLGLVGESGCGKSLTALALLRLIPPPGRMSAAALRLQGRDLLALSPREMQRVRGREIALVFQEPMSSLNPVVRIGVQVTEAMRHHLGFDRRTAWRNGVRLLEEMGLPKPEECMNLFPHQLSGGMRQRVLIAAALSCGPRLLIADEPTSALDTTTQVQVLELLSRLCRERNLALLLISHDLGVVASICGGILVMQAGEIVEEAPLKRFLEGSSHPYSRLLLASMPAWSGAPPEWSRPPMENPAGAAPNRPFGCRFHPRCPEVEEHCKINRPVFVELEAGHRVRCFRRPEVSDSTGQGDR